MNHCKFLVDGEFLADIFHFPGNPRVGDEVSLYLTGERMIAEQVLFEVKHIKYVVDKDMECYLAVDIVPVNVQQHTIPLFTTTVQNPAGDSVRPEGTERTGRAWLQRDASGVRGGYPVSREPSAWQMNTIYWVLGNILEFLFGKSEKGKK